MVNTIGYETQSYLYADLEEFLVSEKERSQLKKSFVEPQNFSQAVSLLSNKQQLWILGVAGAGKRTLALALAEKMARQDVNNGIFLIPRSMQWSQLYKLVQRADEEQAIQSSAGIESTLRVQLARILCEQTIFDSNSSLRFFFQGNNQLEQWYAEIPDADAVANRVNQVVTFLSSRSNQYGNGLALFLQAMIETLHEETEEAEELMSIAAELESTFTTSTTSSAPVKVQHTFIIPDALGTIRFERENLDSELRYLERLQESHLLILTSPTEVFEEADQESPLRTKINTPFVLAADSYDKSKKVEIFRNCLQSALDSAKITHQQHKWVVEKLLQGDRQPLQLDQDFARRLVDWLPIDIYRYVFASLPDALVEGQVYDLLRQNADMESRMKTWFVGLEESTKAFILTLVLFANQPMPLIWESHKQIAYSLRQFDNNLAVLPLGILRQRAAPYVTGNGVIDFINPRVYQGVLQEVAMNYREYFLDCLELFQKLSWYQTKIDGQDQMEVRKEFATFVGEVGRHGLRDVEPILVDWANQSNKQVAKSVGAALEHTARDARNAPAIYELLDSWLNQRGEDDASANLRRCVGTVIWRVTTPKSRPEYIGWALRLVGKMAWDRRIEVADSAAFALLKMSRFIPLQRMRSTLTSLARRKNMNYRYVAWGLNEQAGQDEAQVVSLLETWLSLENPERHNVAYYALLTGDKLPKTVRTRLLQQAIISETQQSTFTTTLFRTLRDSRDEDKRNARAAQEAFTQAVNSLEAVPDRVGAAIILDALQRRERDSNSTRAIDEADWICRNILESWLTTAKGSVFWSATYTLWIGESVAPSDTIAWLTKIARQSPEVFRETLLTAINAGQRAHQIRFVLQSLQESTGEDRENFQRLLQNNIVIATTISSFQLTGGAVHDTSNLLNLLREYPMQFLTILDEGLSSESTERVWDNLGVLAQTERFALNFSNALQSGYKEDLSTACRVSDALIRRQQPFWMWIALHALSRSDWLSESEKYPRLQQAIDSQPQTFIQVMHWYVDHKENVSGFRVSMLGMCASDSQYRQTIINACVTTLRREQISMKDLRSLLDQSANLNSPQMRAEINKQIARAELNDNQNRSFTRLLQALFDAW